MIDQYLVTTHRHSKRGPPRGPPCASRAEKARKPSTGQRRPALPRADPAVPSARCGLASGFGMGPGVSPGPWPPQIFSCTVRRWGLPACGGLGTGQRTRICRCFVLWPDNAHCRLVPFAGGRCGPTARGWNVSVAFRPLVPVGSTPRGASTSGLSTTCSAWGLQELEGSTECLSWSRLPA